MIPAVVVTLALAASGPKPVVAPDTALAFRFPYLGSAEAVRWLPFGAKRGATIGQYRIGFWPAERARRGGTLPEGFLEVTPAAARLHVSPRFRLGDFLTKGQERVWPKYLVLAPTLVEKLERLGDRLEALGRPAKLVVMSGFRTPDYNAGGGSTAGRASDSQHMYGTAADVYVDADGNGRMDDLNRDGRVTRADAAWLLAVADEVEQAHPHLVGGLSAYNANSAHGPFVHVDVRGRRARW
ncbi:MAG TPA: D-Ala-D-Ala carboxypeptidase family metallohydrolase [Gemmatimonadales bacterium]|nr:D-Ala-D-Ala carboxypeptidase family metallohydrolase [Gemmatimonadales bacterium]